MNVMIKVEGNGYKDLSEILEMIIKKGEMRVLLPFDPILEESVLRFFKKAGIEVKKGVGRRAILKNKRR